MAEGCPETVSGELMSMCNTKSRVWKMRWQVGSDGHSQESSADWERISWLDLAQLVQW